MNETPEVEITVNPDKLKDAFGKPNGLFYMLVRNILSTPSEDNLSTSKQS
jgi:hypothetical protein